MKSPDGANRTDRIYDPASLRLIANKLSSLFEFEALLKDIATVEGFLLPVEGYGLMLLAAEGPCAGAIVEIGSWMGKSTCCLAKGSKNAGREKVVAVDHFRGSEELQDTEVIRREGTTFGCFKQNLERLGLYNHVTAIQSASADAAASWRGPIRLLFIDGDHSYDGVRRDFESWSPAVVRGGLIAFHDVRLEDDGCPGVTQFYREVVAGGDYVEFFNVRNLAVVQKQR